MLVKLLEPLNISRKQVEKRSKAITDLGHEFVYYDEKTTDPDELVERSKDADIVMIANTPYPVEAIDQNEKLKLINVAFTGVDHVEISSAKNQDILISNAAGYADQAVAELAMGLVLDLYRGITYGNQAIRQVDFSGPLQGKEIKGKIVGIVGTGKIGLMTAKLFKAFGAHLIGNSPHEKSEAKELEMEYVELDDLMKRSDIISLHVPLQPSTRGMISAEKLALMKEDAILINTARGPIVDNDALAEALNQGKIVGAGIDVFDMEPPIPADYKLLHAKNTILTPHVAFLTDEAMERRAKIAFDNTVAFLEGDPTNIIKR
ncbi:2-hydroxyacid dehydrogenase [Jeotgalibaca sp. MA1X17-3]|uniref:2-hydroxyacid dehydrogenase n=1 Tax=Jeotgalibaca sp. MA1X17-3 TaxID=2908211 RepID=UPI001F1B604B|nr:2-hydroxyacid dehydrogenase [Jeotgalibaca sp. MA1X17-3]UJF15992.1 2-hydroxyacid dehydrogenase [Jeotgalibaca sp. MA1X17-3]